MENAFGQPQSVVVFGGTSDIARAIVKRLCRARAHTVVLAGRDQSRLDESAQEARDYGAHLVDTVLFDANRPANARKTVADSFKKVEGPVDLVIIAVGMRGEQRPYEDDATMSARMAVVNFAWPVAALAEIRRRLVAQGSGRILVMSSAAAIRVRRSDYLYDGAKAGLDRLCDGVAESLQGTGVTLQILRPGHVHTKMTVGTRERRFATGVDEVAASVMRGLDSEDRVIWSPFFLRYLFYAVRLFPPRMWHKVNEL